MSLSLYQNGIVMLCLFVTSFARDMYLSGVCLIESFLRFDVEATLLVCHEQNLAPEVPAKPPRLITYDLDRSEFLHHWLQRNSDIIPNTLGGKARRCECPEPDDPFGKHVKGCCWAWFNKNASRWFRKIVSLDYGFRLPEFDAVIWVDSDCHFLRRLTSEEVDRWFGDGSVFFLRGTKRRVIESGIIGFRADPGGHRVLESTIEHYRSGAFRREVRWDDGYQFQVAIGRNPEVRVTDQGGEAVGRGHVVPLSRVGGYIAHFKGTHHLSGIMT